MHDLTQARYSRLLAMRELRMTTDLKKRAVLIEAVDAIDKRWPMAFLGAL